MKRMCKVLAVALLLVLAMSSISYASEWKQDEKGWWYQYDDGSYAQNEWFDIDQTTYYFNSNGYWVEGAMPLTLENYSKVSSNMTFKEVTAILGNPTDHVSHTDIGAGAEYVSDMYYWKSKSGLSISSMIFTGGVLNVKTVSWVD